MNSLFKRLCFIFCILLLVSISYAQDEPLFTLVQDEPIIVAGDGGDWARSLHNSGAVIFHDGQFHMFRNAYPSLPGNSVIGYATSSDAIEWAHYEDNPVLRTDDVPYANMIMASSVIVQDDGTWVLYFLIWDTATRPGAIGRATAADPTGEWFVDDEPVLLSGEDGTWDAAQVTQPNVVLNDNGDGYLMYYTGVDEAGVNRIGLATSTDGITWEKYDNPNTHAPLYAESDPILQPSTDNDWDARSASRGRVVRGDDGYLMVYRTPASGRGFVYGLATSQDGIIWEKYAHNPILPTQGIPQIGSLFFPTLSYHDGTYYFFIEAFSGSSRIYLLTLEASTPIQTERIAMPTVSTLVEELPSATGGLAVDAEGYVYAANIGRVPARLGTEIYRIAPDGTFELWVQDERLRGASGNTFDADGNLFQSSLTSSAIIRVTPDGTVEEFASDGIRGPVGVVLRPDNTLLVANCRSSSIQQITVDGESSTFANSTQFRCPNGITLDPNGNAYVANFGDGLVLKITPEGEVSPFATIPGGNNGHILYHDGLLYVVGRGSHSIYTLTLDGQLSLFAGTGARGHDNGSALEATFNLPNDIIVSPDGRFLYVNEAQPNDGNNIPSTIRVIELVQDSEE